MRIPRLLKIAAYMKAPVQTFAVLHPWRAAKLWTLFWVGSILFGSRRPRHRHVRVVG